MNALSEANVARLSEIVGIEPTQIGMGSRQCLSFFFEDEFTGTEFDTGELRLESRDGQLRISRKQGHGQDDVVRLIPLDSEPEEVAEVIRTIGCTRTGEFTDLWPRCSECGEPASKPFSQVFGLDGTSNWLCDNRCAVDGYEGSLPRWDTGFIWSPSGD